MKISRIASFASLGSLVALAAACAGPSVISLGGTSAAPTTTQSQATPTPGPSNTPAPNAVCRAINVAPGSGTAQTDSEVVLSALSGDAASQLGATGFAPGAVTLCAAPAVGNKSALTLLNDATMAISLPQSNCACAKLLAAGTTGTLYHGPDTDLLDFTVSVNSGGAGGTASAPVLTPGPGVVNSAGDVRITFSARVTSISAASAACTAAACETAVAAVAISNVDFTTGNAVSTMTNATQGGTVTSTLSGTPFGFGSDWSVVTTPGGLAGGTAEIKDQAPLNKDITEVQRVAEAAP